MNWELLMGDMDLNDDGRIDYEEFCLTASKNAENMNKETIDKAFKFFDQDNDNYISKDELKLAFIGQKQDDDLIWDKVFEEVDKNGDARIDKDEFYDAIKKGINL